MAAPVLLALVWAFAQALPAPANDLVPRGEGFGNNLYANGQTSFFSNQKSNNVLQPSANQGSNFISSSFGSRSVNDILGSSIISNYRAPRASNSIQSQNLGHNPQIISSPSVSSAKTSPSLQSSKEYLPPNSIPSSGFSSNQNGFQNQNGNNNIKFSSNEKLNGNSFKSSSNSFSGSSSSLNGNQFNLVNGDNYKSLNTENIQTDGNQRPTILKATFRGSKVLHGNPFVNKQAQSSQYLSNNFGKQNLLVSHLSSFEDIHTDTGSLESFGLPPLSNDGFNSHVSSMQITGIQIPTPSTLKGDPFGQTQQTLSASSSQALGGKLPGIHLDISSEEDNTLIGVNNQFPVTSTNTQNFGIPLPGSNIGSQGTVSTIQSFETPIATKNFGSQKSFISSQSFGIPLPNNNVGTQHDASSSQSFGISLHDKNIEGSNVVSNTQSFGVPLPGSNIGSQTHFLSTQSFGIPSTHSSNKGSQENISTSQSIGIPLPNSNIGGQNDASNLQSFVPAHNRNIENHNIASTTQSFGIPLPDSSEIGIQRDVSASHTIGIPLPGSSNIGIKSDVSASQSIGIPLPKSNIGSQNDISNLHSFVPLHDRITGSHGIVSNTQSLGIPLPGSNTVSQKDVSISQTYGLPLPDSSNIGGQKLIEIQSDVSASQSSGIPLPNSNIGSQNDALNTQSFVPLQDRNIESQNVISNTHSVGIPLPGSNIGSQKDVSTSQSFGISLPSSNVKTDSDASTSQNLGVALPGISTQTTTDNFNNGISVNSNSGLTVISDGDSKMSFANTETSGKTSSTILTPTPVEIRSSNKISSIDDQDKVASSNVLTGAGGVKLDLGSMTVGELLKGLNGTNGIMVLPMSSVEGIGSDLSSLPQQVNIVKVPGESVESSATSASATTKSSVSTTRRTFARRTTTPIPDTFRRTLSDILYSKGEFFGTLIGGIIDFGRITRDAFKKNIGTSTRVAYVQKSY